MVALKESEPLGHGHYPFIIIDIRLEFMSPTCGPWVYPHLPAATTPQKEETLITSKCHQENYLYKWEDTWFGLAKKTSKEIFDHVITQYVKIIIPKWNDNQQEFKQSMTPTNCSHYKQNGKKNARALQQMPRSPFQRPQQSTLALHMTLPWGLSWMEAPWWWRQNVVKIKRAL